MTPSTRESIMVTAEARRAPAAASGAARASLPKSLRVYMPTMIQRREAAWLPGGDGFGDRFSVEAAVLDENLVGVHSGDDDAGEVDAGAAAFKRLRIDARTKRAFVEYDAHGGKEL